MGHRLPRGERHRREELAASANPAASEMEAAVARTVQDFAARRAVLARLLPPVGVLRHCFNLGNPVTPLRSVRDLGVAQSTGRARPTEAISMDFIIIRVGPGVGLSL